MHTMKYYSALKWKEVLTNGILMNFENMLSETSQTQKDNYFMIPFIIVT